MTNRSNLAATRLMLSAVALIFVPGCITILPSDFISSLILNPETTCQELVVSLQLGSLPDASTPADVGFQFESITTNSANGRQLDAWFVPAQQDGQLDTQPIGTVLIMHGTDGALACALPWVSVAVNNHMHALLFDYQGYGNSEGTADISTQLDDSEAMLNWITTDETTARQNVHLLGVSLGTGPALGLATLRSKSQIKSVALDGAYDPEAIIAAVEPSICPIFPLFGASARLGFEWLFQTREQLGDLTIPVMFLHAEQDAITPIAGSQTMYNLVGSEDKSFWYFRNLTHVQPLFLSEEQYVSLLVTFWRAPAEDPSSTASTTDDTIHVPSLSS